MFYYGMCFKFINDTVKVYMFKIYRHQTAHVHNYEPGLAQDYVHSVNHLQTCNCTFSITLSSSGGNNPLSSDKALIKVRS